MGLAFLLLLPLLAAVLVVVGAATTRRERACLRRLLLRERSLRLVLESVIADEDVFAVVSAQLARLLEVDSAAVIRFDGDVGHVVGSFDVEPHGLAVGARIDLPPAG